MPITTNYGSWYKATHEATPAASILTAVGDYHADYDLDAIEEAYRDAIDEALPDGVFLTGDQLIGPYHEADQNFDGYPRDEDGRLDIGAIIRGIDLMAIVEANELWTIDQVVGELGFNGDSAKGTARKTLSRWGVDRYDMVDHPDSGRPQARYKAADVKAAKAAAPRPRRTA